MTAKNNLSGFVLNETSIKTKIFLLKKALTIETMYDYNCNGFDIPIIRFVKMCGIDPEYFLLHYIWNLQPFMIDVISFDGECVECVTTFPWVNAVRISYKDGYLVFREEVYHREFDDILLCAPEQFNKCNEGDYGQFLVDVQKGISRIPLPLRCYRIITKYVVVTRKALEQQYYQSCIDNVAPLIKEYAKLLGKGTFIMDFECSLPETLSLLMNLFRINHNPILSIPLVEQFQRLASNSEKGIMLHDIPEDLLIEFEMLYSMDGVSTF